MYGRGASDDKGPLLGWLNVLEAHVKSNIELPVNLRFCFEGAICLLSLFLSLSLIFLGPL
jgi:Peptidase family M20/M25/M40